ncbi:MAG: DUF6382 domain-containing protein [Lachnospiraceae bacterium]|nr:DUF6382 domain-containing protein [Lachnospiraceae bacterium]
MDNLQLSYEMGGSGNYLSASLEEEVNTYQLKMIENNNISGILPIHSMRMNGMYKLQYDITGKSRLIDYLNKENCSGRRAVKVLYSFLYALVHAEEYLLTYKQFLLEKEYIYLNENDEVSFVYLPLSTRAVTTPEHIQSFIKGLLLEHFTADGDAFFLGLLRYVSMPEYSLLGLLKKLEAEQEKGMPSVKQKEPVRSENAPVAALNTHAGAANVQGGNSGVPVKGQAGAGMSAAMKKSEEPVKKTSEPPKKKGGPEGEAGVFNFAVPGMAAAPSVPVKKDEKHKEKTKEKKPSFFDSLLGGKNKEKPAKAEAVPTPVKEVKAEAPVNKMAGEGWVGTQIVGREQEYSKTVCLTDDEEKVEAVFEHAGKRVSLTHFPYYVGRENADYVIARPRISRKHIHIIKREERYYVIDDNSTNHTYLNGNIIAPYTEIEITSGDNIRLADETLTFYVESRG